MRVEEVSATGGVVRIIAETVTPTATCTGCGAVSDRVHSRYTRQLSDVASSGREVLIRLRVRRLFCGNTACAKTTFAEQLPELAGRYARRTTILQQVLTAVALALGGRAGARLTRHLAASISRMTLLRLVRGLPDPDPYTPRVLGVGDFALRRGHHYGTILIDVETGRPIDVLTDRTAASLADWLSGHPGVEIICRDRAGAYAEGAHTGAPEALQVTDRWHVWNNLADAIERTVAQHRAALSAADTEGIASTARIPSVEERIPPETPTQGRKPVTPEERTDRWAVRARKRHASVHALRDDGVGINEICRRLELARGTVRRFARAATVEELLACNGTGRRPSLLEVFKPYLHERWNAGCTNATTLFTEITARGYQGGPTLVRHYLHQFRTATHIRQPAPIPPSVRRVVGWIMTNPANLDPADQTRLDAILAASPALTALAGHVRGFAALCVHCAAGTSSSG